MEGTIRQASTASRAARRRRGGLYVRDGSLWSTVRVSLMGGRGSLWGAFGGAILLEAVGNGLNLMSLSFYAVYIVEGLVVLAALLTDAGLRRRLAAR